MALQMQVSEDRLLPMDPRISTILDNIVDGVITIDERGTIQSVNRATQEIFGYQAKELIGQNVRMLMPAPYHHEHDGYIANYLRTGEKKVIGIGREVVGKRHDGTTFPIDLGVNEAVVEGRRLFTGIIRDITARKVAELAKKEFISIVSHELRTPLTSIYGALGLIAGGAVGEIPDQARMMLDIALKNSERLISLINEILDIEKIESDEIDLNIQSQELMPLVHQSIETHRTYGQQYGVEFVLTGTLPNIQVRVDAGRLQQVLENLLSNAAKFSGDSSQVEISVSQADGVVRVAVTDHGVGIPEELQGRVFERFTQADSSDHRQQGGTGLGLSIAQAIIRRFGGQIGFETEIGVGTTFHFDLPCTYDCAKQESLQLVAASPKPRVLVCEDDETVAQILRAMLEQVGYHTDLAFDARQAKQLLSERDYAAMTLDVLLPDQNGLSLLRDLRANEKTHRLPIVVVSATARNAELLVGNAIGVLDWIQKPIEPEHLFAVLQQAVLHHKPEKLRILHIEDDDDVLRVVSTVLQGTAEVTYARDAENAKERLMDGEFDLIILDIGLPDGDGLALVPMIQEHQGSIPVLVFSAQELTTESAQDIAASLVKSRTSNQQLLATIRNLVDRETSNRS